MPLTVISTLPFSLATGIDAGELVRSPVCTNRRTPALPAHSPPDTVEYRRGCRTTRLHMHHRVPASLRDIPDTIHLPPTMTWWNAS